jgi:amidase
MIPVAHGNDGGGSIRIPAACCGLVGLKPSRGSISTAPELGDSSLVVDGVLTRTVADTAAILDVVAGYEPGDATWAPPPAEPFARSAGRTPCKLLIAATTLPPTADTVVDPLCARAVTDAAELLRSLGHEVDVVDPPWPVEGLSELFGVVFSNHIALSIAYSGMVAGRGVGGISAEDMEPMSWAIFSMIQTMTPWTVWRRACSCRRARGAWSRSSPPMTLCSHPPLAERPLPLGTLDTAAPDPMATFTRSGLFTPFTPVFTPAAAGHLAAAVPRRGRAAAGGPARRTGRRRGGPARARGAARSGSAVV